MSYAVSGYSVFFQLYIFVLNSVTKSVEITKFSFTDALRERKLHSLNRFDSLLCDILRMCSAIINRLFQTMAEIGKLWKRNYKTKT